MKLKKILLIASLCFALLLSGCVEKVVDPTKYVTIGEYKGVAVTALSTEVFEEEIDNAVKQELVSGGHVTYETIVDRPLQNGDLANIDFTGYIDDVAFDGGAGTSYELEIGSGSFIAGFEEQLIGLESGGARSILVTFPEDYNDELGGKEARFDVKLNSIQSPIYPALTDEFVVANLNFSSLENMRATIRTSLQQSKDSQQQQKIQQDAWTAVLDATTVISLPQDKVKQAYDYMTEVYDQYAVQYGVSLEELITTYVSSTMEEFENYKNEYANNSVKEEMTALSIAEKEGMTASEAEISAMTSSFMSEYGYTDKATFYKEALSEADVKMSVLYDKVIAFVVENANVTYP